MLSTQDDAAWRRCVNRFLILTRGRAIWFRGCGLAKTLSEQVGHLDEEGAAVRSATEARLKLTGERTEPVANEIIIVADIKSGAWIRCPAKEKLAFEIGRDRIKVDPAARKNESRELISSTHRNDVFVKGQQLCVVPAQTLLGEAQGKLQRRRWLIGDDRIHVKERTRPGIPRSSANGGRIRSTAQTGGLSIARGHGRNAYSRITRAGAEIKIKVAIRLVGESVEVELLVHR